MTLYGLYTRERGGWLSVARLVRLLGHLGVDGPLVRSAVSRLKRRGLLIAERSGASRAIAFPTALPKSWPRATSGYSRTSGPGGRRVG
ncbi:hypothetical protein AB0L88_09560 [Saccharopolyspora shandongensis]|uniref:hypothetical protein n=1 Tax=Saccharopolyspora shandongensis TaxID=418495 RepID=UPI0034242B2E